MSFGLLVIYLFLSLVRPAEQIPALREWALMDVVSALALAATALTVLAGRGPTLRAVQLPLMFAFLAWTAVSVAASPLRSASAFEGVLSLAKSSGTAFVLVVLNVTSARRLRIVAVTFTVSALLLAGQAVVEYRHLTTEGSGPLGGDSGSAWGEAEGPTLGEGADFDSHGRVYIAGLFGDPNDLAVTLVGILPFALAFRRTRARFHNALIVWVPVGLIVYGIYVTRSRGGLLALVCVLALSVHQRLGTLRSVLIGAGALALLLAVGFLGGRSISIDMSAAGRIDAWSDGLQMLRSSPVWGIGLEMFTEYHPRAAHSSFVQCFAELGIVGYVLWLGLIMLTIDDLRATMRNRSDDPTDLRRWARALLIAISGFLIGAALLSRSYDVYLFILLALGTAVADLARRRGFPAPVRTWPRWICLVSAVAASSIIGYWLYMRLLR